ncbi:rCG41336, isoform CRA_b [Rattus norvegicus]|uniref:RCG41336, isoform CRA_b n=1 Tax=Rattus norvegicus TaxID=10116 RepID=A6IHP9_RAT|nr:rCG41336, isoform CRA_b [Rattus norvegicus]
MSKEKACGWSGDGSVAESMPLAEEYSSIPTPTSGKHTSSSRGSDALI